MLPLLIQSRTVSHALLHLELLRLRSIGHLQSQQFTLHHAQGLLRINASIQPAENTDQILRVEQHGTVGSQAMRLGRIVTPSSGGASTSVSLFLPKSLG